MLEFLGNTVGGLLNGLVNLVFIVISSIMDAIMTPFVNIVLTLVPDLTTPVLNFQAFLASGFTYLTCIYRWLLFTPEMFSALFLYFLTKYAIFITTNAVRLAIKLYDKLKP